MAGKRLFLLAALLCAAPAAAATDCRAAAGGEQAKLLACDASEAVAADARLNTSYGAARRALPAAMRPGLVKAQRAWLAFRTAECDARYRRELPGQDAPRVREQCLVELTTARTAQLDQVPVAAGR